MVGTVANSPTSDAYLDGLMFTKKLDSTNITFSFPSAASNYGGSYNSAENESAFEEFNATQKAAIRKILAMYAESTPFVFTEMTETDGDHADFRFAMSDVPTTAHAYTPWLDTVFRIGDAWFRNTGGTFDNPVPGNYAWLTMLHETGHCLGLNHPHEGGSGFADLPSDRSWVEWTVMAYNSFEGDPPGGGYQNDTWGFPATPMERDIAVLQHLYGANTTIRSGGTEYHINPTTGELKIGGVAYLTPGANRVLYAIPWDTGGVNTLNLIDYTTNVTLNLNAGVGSILSTTQLAQLGSGPIMADANLYIYSLDGVDTDSLPNRIIPGSGTDTIAGNGLTTLALTGNRNQYAVTDLGGGSWRFIDSRGSPGPNGTTTIDSGVILVEFADATVTPPVAINRHRVAW